MRFGKKLHYALKYLILALPILLILGVFITRDTNYQTFYNSFVNGFNALINNIAGWYHSVLDYLQIDLTNINPTLLLIVNMPVYIFYVYVIDIFVDIITFIPKFLHDIFNKEVNY